MSEIINNGINSIIETVDVLSNTDWTYAYIIIGAIALGKFIGYLPKIINKMIWG